MEVTVEKVVGSEYMKRACESTMHGQKSKVSLKQIYKCEHSPMRTQMFWVEMKGIPTYVSVHFSRHKIWCEHFVESNRSDRGGSDDVDRNTPVNHAMFLNATALVAMARKRLCLKADVRAVEVMGTILEAVRHVDPDLAEFMVPECEYRGNVCHELSSCGRMFD